MAPGNPLHLRPSQAKALATIIQAPREYYASQIARNCDVSEHTTFRNLSEMLDREFLTLRRARRRPRQQGKPRCYYSITDLGRQAYQEYLEEMKEMKEMTNEEEAP